MGSQKLAALFVLAVAALPRGAGFLVPGTCRPRTLRLAALEQDQSQSSSAEHVRRKLKEKEDAYSAERARQQRESLKHSAFACPDLGSLERTDFLDADGELQLPELPAGTRASIFAVFDAQEALAFVGVTRSAVSSLRQILARQPEEAHAYAVHHVSKPSKAALELIKSTWIEGAATPPKGNVNELVEATWEGATDIRGLMTAEEQAYVEEQRLNGKEGPALRKVARKYEAEKAAALEARGLKTPLRFDPKLKLLGLLDLHQEKKK